MGIRSVPFLPKEGAADNFWSDTPSVWLFLCNQAVFIFSSISRVCFLFPAAKNIPLPCFIDEGFFVSIPIILSSMIQLHYHFALVENLFFPKKLEECCSSSPPTTCLNGITLQQSSINNVPCPWSRKCIMLFCTRKLTDFIKTRKVLYKRFYEIIPKQFVEIPWIDT